MPNWCENNLIIETDDKQILKDLELIYLKGTDRELINSQQQPRELILNNPGLLSYFRPMPIVLQGTVKGSHPPKWQTDNSQWLKDCYGYDNWYDWSINNWGTKWDVHKMEKINDHRNTFIELEFETAWGPPVEALQYWNYIKNFYDDEKNFKCYLSYVEPGMDFCGVYVGHEDKTYHQSEYSNNRDLPNIPKGQDSWVRDTVEAYFFEDDEYHNERLREVQNG